MKIKKKKIRTRLTPFGFETETMVSLDHYLVLWLSTLGSFLS